MRPFLVLIAVMCFVAEGSAHLAQNVTTRFDFRSFYGSGVLFRHAPCELYNLTAQDAAQWATVSPGHVLPYFGPAYEAALFAPLSWIRYQHAYAVMIAINIALLLCVFLLLRDELSVTIPIWQPRPGFMLIPFLPVLVAVAQGQLSIMLLCCCAACWAMLRSGRPALAGLLLSLAVFKFNLIVPLALLLSIRWGWKLGYSFLAGAACWFLVPLQWCGGNSLLGAYRLLYQGSPTRSTELGIFARQMCSLWGLVSFAVPESLVFGVTALLSVCLLGLCAWWIRRRSLDDASAFALATLGALAVSYHLYIHDLTLILLPVALLYPRLRGREWIMAALYAVPLILFSFFAHPPFFVLGLFPLGLLAMSRQLVEPEAKRNGSDASPSPRLGEQLF
jgi:hypothetical protein